MAPGSAKLGQSLVVAPHLRTLIAYILFVAYGTLIAILQSMKDEGAGIMTTTPKMIRVTEETALTAVLDDAAREPIILERDGERFRLSRDEGIAYEPDPEQVRATLAVTLGSWADLDADEMIREIYAAREAGTRPLDRP
jgi:hypothetical protein